MYELNVGQLLLVIYCIFSTVITNRGNGRHQWDLSMLAFLNDVRVSVSGGLHEAARVITMTDINLQLLNIIQAFYPPMIFAAKLLILVQYLRIFAPIRGGFTFWATHFLIWTNFMFYVAIFFVVIFECTPREKIWKPARQGTCVKINAVFITTGTWNVFSDLSILILPIRAIWLLQMATRKKWQISAVFATGLL